MRYFADPKRMCTANDHNFPIYMEGGFHRTLSCAKDTDYCKCGQMTFKEYKYKQNKEMFRFWEEVTKEDK